MSKSRGEAENGPRVGVFAGAKKVVLVGTVPARSSKLDGECMCARRMFFFCFALIVLCIFLFLYSAGRRWLQNYEKLRVQVAQLGRDRGTVPAVLG